MREFRDGAIDVLVCTTVVEVGIDVPEATIIVIVAAERYGLAQLHQLRGRVGRGEKASRCCIVASSDADEAALERLAKMRECTTGAAVAEADLALRGPGDLLGARQTGALPLKFVHLFATIARSNAHASWLTSGSGATLVGEPRVGRRTRGGEKNAGARFQPGRRGVGRTVYWMSESPDGWMRAVTPPVSIALAFQIDGASVSK